MKDPQQVVHLYQYHIWANHRVIDHMKKLPDEIFTREIKSAFPTLQQGLAHICYIDRIWFGVLEGKTYEHILAETEAEMIELKYLTLPELEMVFADMAGRYSSYLAAEDNLERIVISKHPRFGPLETPISELVRHVVNHGTYHRGMICAMLHQLGYSGVNTDYIFFN
ncbi:DinB family protein [Gorillibacterium massiliense]|uniref:DinB family protein n=1 Tax=Gorillibacterium massiliense TaxID=1280390 RepID=UPI0004B2E803|nr:DinB family protein [Gorillibacterium massiliense]